MPTANDAYLDTQDVASGDHTTLSMTWQQQGVVLAPPANAARLEIELVYQMSSGWIAFDSLALSLHDTRLYYSAGGSRLGVRVNEMLFWLLSDHLGSTTVAADSSGGKTAELRYKAWGENRQSDDSMPTTLGYTGQRSEEYITFC